MDKQTKQKIAEQALRDAETLTLMILREEFRFGKGRLALFSRRYGFLKRYLMPQPDFDDGYPGAGHYLRRALEELGVPNERDSEN